MKTQVEHQIMFEEDGEELVVTCGCGYEDRAKASIANLTSMELAAQEHIRESACREYVEAHSA